MVSKNMVEKASADDAIRPEKRSRHGTPESPDYSSDEERGGGPEGVMRVGRDYQALIPLMIPISERRNDLYPDKALLVWSPSTKLTGEEVDNYIIVAKDKYGYNAEQALGMLFWHKHDIKKAETDLSNYTPFPDEWTPEDKVIFEQAFQFHSKSFQRIRQMLPDKTIAALVRYYYSWKKTRSQTSLMDSNGQRNSNAKAAIATEDIKSSQTDISSSESESEEKEKTFDVAPGLKGTCTNCGISCQHLIDTAKGPLCGTCADFLRKNGKMRPTTGPTKRGGRQNVPGEKRRAPRGMHLDHDDLKAFASASDKGDSILKAIGTNIASLKRKVQLNKQQVSSVKRDLGDGLGVPRPTLTMISKQWTNEEIALLIEAVPQYGRSFKKIAEIITTKTDSQVRCFVNAHGHKHNLSELFKAYENSHKKVVSKEVKMDTDEKTVESTECIAVTDGD